MRKPALPAPDPNVLFYRRNNDNGRTDFATMQTIEDHGNGSWRAHFLIPGQAPYFINQFSDELRHWEPVYAVTQDDISSVVERVAQRVVEILDSRKSSPGDIVSAAMAVVQSDTVQEAVVTASGKLKYTCGGCGKSYKYERSYNKHVGSCNAG